MPLLNSRSLTLALFAGTALASTAHAQMGPEDVDGPADRGQQLLKLFDKIDTDKDGKLTLAELEAYRTAQFTAADTNGDGALDTDELAARDLARFQEGLATRTQRMIDNRDNDGNGTLSVDEMGKGPVENRFARIDTDNDGAISKDEAEAALKHRKKRGRGWGMGGN